LPGQPGTAPGPATAVHLASRRGRRLVVRPAGGTGRALRTGQLLQRGSASGLRARPTPSSAAGLPAGALGAPAGIRASLMRQDGFKHSDRRPGAYAALPVSCTRRRSRALRILLSGGRFEFHHQFGRHAAAVFDLDSLGFGPLADFGGVQPARRRPAPGSRWPASSAVAPPRSAHIARKRLAQLLGMLFVQVDLVLGTVQPETDLRLPCPGCPP